MPFASVSKRVHLRNFFIGKNVFAWHENKSLLKNYKPSRNLRSVDQGLLTVPKSNQRTYGDRAFSVAAPKLWNSLPLDIRNSGSITLFKCKLKTFLFKKYYL